MTDRDTTVGGLLRKLQGLIDLDPRVAGYDVMLGGHGETYAYPWHGTTFRDDQAETLELNAAD